MGGGWSTITPRTSWARCRKPPPDLVSLTWPRRPAPVSRPYVTRAPGGAPGGGSGDTVHAGPGSRRLRLRAPETGVPRHPEPVGTVGASHARAVDPSRRGADPRDRGDGRQHAPPRPHGGRRAPRPGVADGRGVHGAGRLIAGAPSLR